MRALRAMVMVVYSDFFVFDTNCGHNRKCSGRFPSLIYQENSNMSDVCIKWTVSSIYTLYTLQSTHRNTEWGLAWQGCCHMTAAVHLIICNIQAATSGDWYRPHLDGQHIAVDNWLDIVQYKYGGTYPLLFSPAFTDSESFKPQEMTWELHEEEGKAFRPCDHPVPVHQSRISP